MAHRVLYLYSIPPRRLVLLLVVLQISVNHWQTYFPRITCYWT